MNAFPSWPLVVVAGCVLVASLVVWLRRVRTPAGRAALRHVALALLLLVVALRPTLGDASVERLGANIDVVIMVDRTASMAAEDYDGSEPRLSGVKSDLAQVLAQVNGGRVAVITFDNEASVALPFTTDAQAALTLVEVLGWREADYGEGTDIGVGVATARELLARSLEERPDALRFLVYLGDGEQTRDEPFASFEELRPYLDGGLVLGYGTTAGGRMRAVAGGDEYVMRDGQRAVSHADPDNLAAIAAQLGLEHVQRTAPGPLEVDVPEAGMSVTNERVPGGFELYWIAGVLAVGLLAWDLWDVLGRLRAARREVAQW